MNARQRPDGNARGGRNRARARNASRRSGQSGGSAQPKRPKKGGQPDPGGGDANRARGGRKGRRRGGPRDAPASRDSVAFWGDADRLPEVRTDIRITEDPAAVPRSLGRPPLPGHEQIAEHYFTAVYDRAVATAGALAAAGGLIDPEALAEEYGD